MLKLLIYTQFRGREVAGVQPAAPLLLFARTLLFYECTEAIPGWEWRHSIRFVVDQDSLAKQYIEICNSYLDAELNLLSRDYINFSDFNFSGN